MFEVGFSEMVVIAVVALIVIGPERLPKVARTLGHLWGRAQRYVNSVKADISRDMAIEEFRQMQQQVQHEVSGLEHGLQQAAQAVDQQVKQLDSAVIQPAQAAMETVQHELQPAADQPKFPID
ncbi:MAG: Sec-independent protein translocase protein TatB [Gallionellaceae bacterium]|nr:Sec-independent protein translocase protein TatB [Gallionellaceae bacterium]